MELDPKEGRGETTNDLHAFRTCDPNIEVAANHPKTMPVVLTTQEDIETWMRAKAPRMGTNERERRARHPRYLAMHPNPPRPEMTEADIVRARIVPWEPGTTGRDYEFADGTHHLAPIVPEDARVLRSLDERGLVEWSSGCRGWH